MAEDLKSQQKLWEALASLHRRRIMKILLGEELCVRDLKAILGWPQSTTSRHLLYLQKKGFLEARKDGLWRYYRLRPPQGAAEKALWRVLDGLGGEPFSGDETRTKERVRALKKLRGKKYSSQFKETKGPRFRAAP